MSALIEFLDHNCEVAKAIFSDCGQVHSMWIIQTKSGQVIPIPASFKNEADKNAAVAAIKHTLDVLKAPRYAFVTEAWILTAASKAVLNDAYDKYDSLEQHPDRREVLMVTAEDRHETMMRTYYILRPEHGKPTLSPAEELNSDKSEGRFANLLPKEE